jgi:hypothetical protein
MEAATRDTKDPRMPSSIGLVQSVAAAIVVAGLAAGGAPVSAAMVVAVVPFAQPGAEKVQYLDDATGVLTAELTERGLTPKTLAATDRLAVVAQAGRICAQTGATGIFVPTMRTEQAVRQRNNVLTPVDYYATHVDLRLSLVRCDGSLSWTGTAVGDKDYVDANVQAGFADGITQAIGRVLELFASRTPDTARPNATATPAPRLPKGPKIAIVPFTQLGMEPDPSLDFATEEARKRYVARGYDAVVTEPADHLIATKNAPAMCARYDASRLVMGTLRWEQMPKSDGVATHAEIMLSTVDCTGRVIATQDEIGDHLHHGANYRAGVSAAIEDAFAHWADQPLPAPKT